MRSTGSLPLPARMVTSVMRRGLRAAARRETTQMLANVNDTTLYYELLGDGPPLMFMHGGLGFDHTYFRPWVDPLAEDFTLILYDHRGNGRSERPPDLDDVSHSTWADDAEALRQHLGIDRMILLGQSYGGVIALHYALRYQEHLAGLILATAHPAWDYMDVVLEKARQKGTPEEAAAIERRFFEHLENDEDLANLAATIGGLYFHDPDCEAAKTFGIETRFSAAAYNHSVIDIHSRHNVVDRLGEIDVPTLVLCGADDFITPYEQCSARIHWGIPGSKLVMFERSGHMVFAEEQQKFLDVVRRFAGGLT